ncbi:HprK-related kinase A [Emcibacter sp.]|uniref:HprK-related kinase A n=1 Tax=Emcibacter sp. TaxID=1979954 RepID=UPI002AA61EF5|nr:HprK-related kinase A [Emcibacter sp.]
MHKKDTVALAEIPDRQLGRQLKTGGISLEVGPFVTQVRILFPHVRRQFCDLYGGYPVYPEGTIANNHLNVYGRNFYRRWIKPQACVDTMMKDAFIPLHADLGLVATEMGLNWQVAVGCKNFLLFHAGVVERNGRVVIMPAASGSGKSTLAAGLSFVGWRLFSDEFGLADINTGDFVPYPRPVSLKNESIPVMKDWASEGTTFSKEYEGTPKGTICYMRPPEDSISRMFERAKAGAIILPVFDPDAKPEIRPITRSMAFFKIVMSSANYGDIGERSFRIMTDIADSAACCEIVYPNLEEGIRLVERFVDENVDPGPGGGND